MFLVPLILTNFDSNRTVFNLLNNPDGILEYKIFVPTIESQPTDDGRLLIDLSSKLKKENLNIVLL